MYSSFFYYSPLGTFFTFLTTFFVFLCGFVSLELSLGAGWTCFVGLVFLTFFVLEEGLQGQEAGRVRADIL